MLNAYEIEGRVYEAANEYDAVKKAYKMANSVSMQEYVGNEEWLYVATFSHGTATVIVRRVRRLPIDNETNKQNYRRIEMEKIFESTKNLTGYAIIRPCVEELERLWKELGEPTPADGPTTSLNVRPTSLSNAGDMGDGASQDDADAYNDLIEALFSLIDYHHIGSGIWYTQYNSGTDEWQNYQEIARTEIDEFISEDLWERFLDLHEWV